MCAWTSRRRSPAAGLALAALLALTGCGAEASLQQLEIGDGQAFLSVGVPARLTITGRYSDGSRRPVTSGLTWASSDQAVASVDAEGQVTPWAAGTAELTATDQATGVTGTVAVTARVVTVLRAGGQPLSTSVDRTAAYFRVGGLTPASIYSARLTALSDDADLALYADPSLSSASQLCLSDSVGTLDEECLFEADASGEIWVVADGSWTRDGADFALSVAPAQPVALAGTLTYPRDLPFAGHVGRDRAVYRVDGLAPGGTYQVAITGLTADVDLAVWGDGYAYDLRCESLRMDLAEDACSATADAAGTLYVELDGLVTPAGGDFTLDLTPP